MATRVSPYVLVLGLVVGFVASAGCSPAGSAAVQLQNNPTCDGGNLKDCETRCASNEARACYRLGWFYEGGQSVPRDVKKALDLYGKACDGNMAVACRALGYLYNGGGKDLGIELNKKLAGDFYAKACTLGIAAACYSEPAMVSVGANKAATPEAPSVGDPSKAKTPSPPSAPDGPPPAPGAPKGP